MKLFRFVYRVYPDSALGESCRPVMKQVIIAAQDLQDAAGLLPDSIRHDLVSDPEEKEVKRGVLFQ